MSWAWLALVDARPDDADAAARLRTLAGEPAGVLAAWRRHAKPVRHALRADARIVDPEGASARISLVLPPEGYRLAFDDLAVQQARRDLLAGEPFDAVTTLLPTTRTSTARSSWRAASTPPASATTRSRASSKRACCTWARVCSAACHGLPAR